MLETPASIVDTKLLAPAALPWRLLGVATSEPAGTAWLVRLQAELKGDLRLSWVPTLCEALDELRQSAYSGIVVGDLPLNAGSVVHPAEDFVRALRAMGDATPVVVLIPLPLDAQVATLLEWGCEVCVTPRLWDSPALPLTLARAIRQAHQSRELEHLRAIHQRRLAREQSDAATLMQLQRYSLQRLIPSSNPVTTDLSEALSYDALLRSYLVSPATALEEEIAVLLDELYQRGFGPQAVRTLHVQRLDELLTGLGGRASRQILARADVLALDIITQLGERYRRAA